MTSTVIYEGGLRTVAIHNASGTRIETDAPVDNQGKGERFSPSDLVATSLGSCMLTIMGMKARDLDSKIHETRPPPGFRYFFNISFAGIPGPFRKK